MEEVAAALRDLAESNRQILAKIEAIDAEKKHKEVIEEERRQKRRNASFEMDIEYIMQHKKWSREKAIERLRAQNYNVAKVIQAEISIFLKSDDHLEHVLCHYEYKKNRLMMEGLD